MGDGYLDKTLNLKTELIYPELIGVRLTRWRITLIGEINGHHIDPIEIDGIQSMMDKIETLRDEFQTKGYKVNLQV